MASRRVPNCRYSSSRRPGNSHRSRGALITVLETLHSWLPAPRKFSSSGTCLAPPSQRNPVSLHRPEGKCIATFSLINVSPWPCVPLPKWERSAQRLQECPEVILLSFIGSVQLGIRSFPGIFKYCHASTFTAINP